MSQRITGTVKWFDASKGYGYIDAGIDEDIFVYYQSIKGNGLRNLLEGDQVEFDMIRKPSGPVALDVTRS
ncbi:MAG: cold shock domain-containing protein [Anaerolineae bacterium]|nr:cold shock domain-containing protein [Anaerolineae bacterium]